MSYQNGKGSQCQRKYMSFDVRVGLKQGVEDSGGASRGKSSNTCIANKKFTS
jgi:hypothetical protein